MIQEHLQNYTNKLNSNQVIRQRPLVTFTPVHSFISTALITSTATVCLNMSRIAKRPNGGYSANVSTLTGINCNGPRTHFYSSWSLLEYTTARDNHYICSLGFLAVPRESTVDSLCSELRTKLVSPCERTWQRLFTNSAGSMEIPDRYTS